MQFTAVDYENQSASGPGEGMNNNKNNTGII